MFHINLKHIGNGNIMKTAQKERLSEVKHYIEPKEKQKKKRKKAIYNIRTW